MSSKKNKSSSRTTGYRVETTSYPSGTGCYAGQDLDEDYIQACTTTTIVGTFDTFAEAKEAAIMERDDTGQFEDWAQDYYKDDADPPYISSYGQNFDEDDTVEIYIVDIAEETKKNAKKKKQVEKAIQEARNCKPPPKKKAKSGPRKFGPQKGNFKPDMEIFLRNPITRIEGGQAHLPTEYSTRGTGKGSFVYLIQRLSYRNYTMRGLCLENAGARYTSFSDPKVIRRCIAWLPDTNLNEHASDDTIVDTFHTDLFNPKTGEHGLTEQSLLAAVTPNTECLFLTNFDGRHSNKTKAAKVITQAIQTCRSNLKCITLNLCFIDEKVLKALAQCTNLSGILLCDNQSYQQEHKLDAGLARVLSSCPHVKWVYADYFPFHDECWSALAAGHCPELEVLWVDCPVSKKDRCGVTAGNHDMIRRVVTGRDNNLRLCMINPDDKQLKSSFIPSDDNNKKAWDRLNGKKAPKIEPFDEYEYGDYGGDY